MDGQQEQQQETRRKRIHDILAIIALIVVVAVALWGIIGLVRMIPEGFFSIFTSPFTRDAEIVLTVDETITSGTSTTIAWEHPNREDGQYTFTYTCRDGVHFEVPREDGTQRTIACDTPQTIPARGISNMTLRLTPVLVGHERAEVPIILSYTDDVGDRDAQATATLTIVGGSVSEPPDDDTDTGTTTPPTGTPSGPADLVIRVLEVGVLDPHTRLFSPRHTITSSDIAAVRFEVRNAGGSRTGTWYFTAELPTKPAHQYTSPRQQGLGPGDRIEYTLSFDQLRRGSQTLTVTADAGNEVPERSDANNTLYHTFHVAQ